MLRDRDLIGCEQVRSRQTEDETVPDGNLGDRLESLAAVAKADDVGGPEPSLPVIPFPTFQNTPTLPQQAPGHGYESGRDSRGR
jgi:hypothetical protein